MRTLKLSLILIILLGLVSCSKTNNNYRRFVYETYMIVEEGENELDNSVFSKYKNTYYDFYEDTMHYNDGEDLKVYKYTFNNGTFEINGLKNQEIKFTGNMVYVNLTINNTKVQLIYKLEK